MHYRQVVANEIDGHIVHAADLHLGSPLQSLERQIGSERASYFRRLARDAFDRLIDVTLEHEADALLLAGDIYDHADREVGAQIRFAKGLTRLRDAGVSIYMVHGNHDPLTKSYEPASALPEGVTVFGSGQVEVANLKLKSGRDVAVAGVSFGKVSEQSNLAAKFADLDLGDRQGVGLLHANVGSAAGHDNYAPCSVDDLRKAPVAYWALGHIHLSEVREIGPNRWWAYSGNLQGRSAKASECGPKGALLVPLHSNGVAQPRLLECSTFQFARPNIDLTGVADAGAAFDAVAAELGALADEREVPLLFRITLVGDTPAHADLAKSAELLELVREAAMGAIGDGEVLKVELATTAEHDRSQLLDRKDLLSAILLEFDSLRSSGPQEALPMVENLEVTTRKIISKMADLDPEILSVALDRAERSLINQLAVQT